MSKKKTDRVPVSMRALIQRINRALLKDGEQLKVNRSWVGRGDDLGYYFVVDINRNFLVIPDANPEKLGQELGVLKSWEILKEEE